MFFSMIVVRSLPLTGGGLSAISRGIDGQCCWSLSGVCGVCLVLALGERFITLLSAANCEVNATTAACCATFESASAVAALSLHGCEWRSRRGEVDVDVGDNCWRGLEEATDARGDNLSARFLVAVS